MTKKMFHIGHTNIEYEVKNNIKSQSYDYNTRTTTYFFKPIK